MASGQFLILYINAGIGQKMEGLGDNIPMAVSAGGEGRDTTEGRQR